MLGKGNPGAKIADLAEGPIDHQPPQWHVMARLAGADRRLYWATAPVANWKIVLNVPNTVISGPVLAIRTGSLGLAGVLLSSLVLDYDRPRHQPTFVRLTAIAQQVAAGDLLRRQGGYGCLYQAGRRLKPPTRPDADETGQLLPPSAL